MDRPKRSAARGVAAAVLACSPSKAKIKIQEAVATEPLSGGAGTVMAHREVSALTSAQEGSSAPAGHRRARVCIVQHDKSASARRHGEKSVFHAGQTLAASVPPSRVRWQIQDTTWYLSDRARQTACVLR
ncbi:hypothetical protein NDU88_003920 [Pleurodeles waltl]|uniref:Secreted protein n=1 Tax=Pleurodeles waltl TaxID=8319 RepID=A0AAV7LH42_PLEWA|nr:hypothetical protein NDU88_003920 [Pleurodeles waltl]